MVAQEGSEGLGVHRQRLTHAEGFRETLQARVGRQYSVASGGWPRAVPGVCQPNQPRPARGGSSRYLLDEVERSLTLGEIQHQRSVRQDRIASSGRGGLLCDRHRQAERLQGATITGRLSLVSVVDEHRGWRGRVWGRRRQSLASLYYRRAAHESGFGCTSSHVA